MRSPDAKMSLWSVRLLEKCYRRAWAAHFISKIEMITARIVEIDCPFHKTQAQYPRVEINCALRVAADEGNMMYALNGIVRRHMLFLLADFEKMFSHLGTVSLYRTGCH